MQEIFDLSDDAGSDGSSDKDAQAGKSSAAAVKSELKASEGVKNVMIDLRASHRSEKASRDC